MANPGKETLTWASMANSVRQEQLTIDLECHRLRQRLVDPVLRLAQELPLVGLRHLLDEEGPVHQQAVVAIHGALQVQLEQGVADVGVCGADEKYRLVQKRGKPRASLLEAHKQTDKIY